MIGQTLNNRYNITARLGKGAMGTVYRATDTQSGQEVALKVISSDLAVDPDMLERFKREGEALRKLRHPNIVGFLDAFQHDEYHVIVMEYVSGGSLYDLLKQGTLSIDRARQIALDLCDALIRAHRLNIVHRDIKPENILLDEEGTPRLADFGVARLIEGTRVTRSGMQVGTPYYMAPEAWKGEALDGQADIWSLGVVLFEMLAGQVPFDGDTGPAVMTKVFSTQAPDLKKLRAEVSPIMAKIVSRMLTRDKSRRYQTIRQVGTDLESGISEPTPRPAKQKGVNPASRFPVFNARLFVVPGILSVGVVITIFLLSNLIIPKPDATEKQSVLSEVSPSSTLSIGSTMTSETDGMLLVYVPSGNFIMGSGGVESDEKPVHTVFLDAYWIDQTEVTNKQFQMCVDHGDCQLPTSFGSSTRDSYFRNPVYENNPVIFVTWSQAVAYCSWSGRRLPTEAEWEKAARGVSGSIYPWGNNSPEFNLANFDASDTARADGDPNGASVYGALNMAGNVWEWVSDWYDDDYYATSPEANPKGPNLLSGEFRVLRGGSWNSSVFDVRSANRIGFDPTNSFFDIGFRCALTNSDGGSTP